MGNKKYLSILEEIKKHGGKEESNVNDKILICDGLNTFIRVFSAIPTTNDDGIHIGGIIGFLKSIAYTTKMLNTTRTIIVFDGKGGSSRRRKLYPEYKNKRKGKIRLNRINEYENIEDERHSMLMQLSRCVEYLETLPLTIVSVDNVEADDVIAYIAKQLLPKSNHIIMSTDKDFLQLVNNRISVWSPTKKKLYKPETLKEEYEITSNNFLIYRILEGDKSDNIPGVNGIGIKTAVKRFPQLLEEKNVSVDDLLKISNKKKDELKIYQNVLDSKKQLRLNYKLMQLNNVDISGSAKLKINRTVNGKIPELAKANFQKMFIEDRMYGALPDIDSWMRLSWAKLNRFAKINNG
jgi:DNA polymerase-1